MSKELELPEPKTTESIGELIGQTVKIVDITLHGRKWPVIELEDGSKHECDNDWASRGATYLYGIMQSDERDFFELSIVDKNGDAGFAQE